MSFEEWRKTLAPVVQEPPVLGDSKIGDKLQWAEDVSPESKTMPPQFAPGGEDIPAYYLPANKIREMMTVSQETGMPLSLLLREPNAFSQFKPEQKGVFKRLRQSWNRGETGVMNSMQMYEELWVNGNQPNLSGRLKMVLGSVEKHKKTILEDPVEARNIFEQGLQGTAGILPGWMLSINDSGPLVGALGVAGAVLGGVTGGPGGVVPGATTGINLGFKFGMTKFWYQQGAGEMAIEMLEEGHDLGKAKAIATFAAIPYALIESLQISQANPIQKKALREVLRQGTFKILARATKNWTIALTSEVLEEVAQEVISMGAVELSRIASGMGLHMDKDWITQKGMRLWDTARESVISMALLPIPGAAVEVAQQFQSRAQAEADVKKRVLESIDQVMKGEGTKAEKETLADTITKQLIKDFGMTKEQIEASSPKVAMPIAKEEAKVAKPAQAAPEVGPVKTSEQVVVEEALPTTLTKAMPDEKDIPDTRTAREGAIIELPDKWIGDRQLAETKADIVAKNHRKDLQKITEKNDSFADLDASVAIYIDMQNALADYSAENIAQLNEYQRSLVEKAQNLTDKQKIFADQIIAENKALGIEGFESGVLKNIIDNYSARIWKLEGKLPGAAKPKFTIATTRARQRTLGSIIEGWSRGLELAVPSVIEAQKIAHKQVSQVIHDRNLVQMGLKAGIFSLGRTDENTVRVKHPNFSKWVPAGKGEMAFGPDVFINEDGTLLRRANVWADKKLGKYLNNVLGESALKDIPVLDFIRKYNQVIKSAILTSTFFHHQAYLRSFMLGSRGIDPVEGYRLGKEAIEQFIPELQELVHEGLTIGKTLDFDPVITQEASQIGKAIDKVPMASNIRRSLKNLAKANTNFLFEKLGPNLKVAVALLEYRAQIMKNQDALAEGRKTTADIAKNVANLVNDDFGGLNLQRMGRNPTAQDIFSFFALAPDWTESNIRTMVKAFNSGNEGKVYREMWGRILLKGVGTTILFNIGMSLVGDDDDFWKEYIKSFKDGSLRWLDIDITPIYRLFGGDEGKRKYISILGHFKDPIKFLTQTFRSAKNKSSVIGRIALEGLLGTDWRGRQFSGLGDLIKTGDPVKWEAFGAKPISPSQYPSFILKQAEQSMPVQAQYAAEWLRGNVDAFDAITKGLGIQTTSVKEKKKSLGYR